MREVVPLDIATNEMSGGTEFSFVSSDLNLSRVLKCPLFPRAHKERRGELQRVQQ